MQYVPTAVQALALALGMGLGAAFPRTRGQALFTRESWINLANGVLLFPVRLILSLTGIYELHVGLVDLTGLPTWLQLLVGFVVLDLARYWVHYADHRVPILWRFHRVHHSVEQMDATAGLRMHLVDFLQLTAIPIAVFGVLFRTSEAWIPVVALLPGIVFDSLEHGNIEMKLDRWWKKAWFWTLNSPAFHCWHHTRDGALKDGNYANVLPMWDRLFGTEVTQPEPPALYGLGGDQRVEISLIGLQLLRKPS
jgi:sterol desaturase/sphingolipid hydroxylase (fatty acid hydroxylase superfamily)